jgi:hypothetical protein
MPLQDALVPVDVPYIVVMMSKAAIPVIVQSDDVACSHKACVEFPAEMEFRIIPYLLLVAVLTHILLIKLQPILFAPA